MEIRPLDTSLDEFKNSLKLYKLYTIHTVGCHLGLFLQSNKHGLGRHVEQAIKSTHSKMKKLSILTLSLPDNLPPYFYGGRGG